MMGRMAFPFPCYEVKPDLDPRAVSCNYPAFIDR